ncbi:BTB/POZ domain-containing protein KCTD9 [Biomphalaria pfeifferi]|uniref:BTB/POZ domain-containing protein KCTD9 n=1 Tax=Biomphalaria pfeifferi TaxID=112525 RepID=A0AAD8FQI4_BIOPF|nr:BTB/POZ domain-containing protein KCTD9 [Biomphalaria pfeifferi]
MRITVFQNGTNSNGKVLAVGSCLETLFADISLKLSLKVTILYNHLGGEIDDITLIRDDDVLYASEGEPFTYISRVYVPSSSILEHESNVVPRAGSDWIRINIGGKLFTTTRSTLTRTDGDSMLARMFSTDSDIEWNSKVDETGAYLIDRSPLYFEPILNYLRHGRLILDKFVNPEGVLEEAKFFGLSSLIENLEELIEQEQLPDDNTPITRRDLVLRLLSTPTNQELRCQGMNFTGSNLSKLDLRYINFKYAILKNANLSGANLSFCNFERADLCKATIDSANLLGVKMLCANLEGTSMRGCYFEDPAGSRANMEGAHMKNVDLEGSHMAGVNLRVATLKNANLQNCDLRGAVLAGADLENCDLTGCDLQEANLRGANLKGATFELMLHPLHMAQAVR